MPYATLWESICRLAGPKLEREVQLSEAIDGSAVSEKIARVEVRRFKEDGLLEGDGEMVKLTDRGRRACDHFDGQSSL